MKDKAKKGKSSRDPAMNMPLNGPGTPLDEKQAELEGNPSRDDKGGYITEDQVDDLGTITDTDIYEGELEAGVNDDLPNDPDSLELLTERELRAGETSDAFEAAEEGLAYVPPIDPPTVPSDSFEGAEVASGMGVSSLEEPYDSDHHSSFAPGDDDLSALVREALRADSLTTEFHDRLNIEVEGNIVVLRGVVDDLVDSDNAIAVAKYVTGVEDVIDKTEVRALQ